MLLNKDDFKWAEERGIISHDQANKLWDSFLNREYNSSSFDLTHILYYLGGFIIGLALIWLDERIYDKFNTLGLIAISLFNALSLFLIGEYLNKAKRLFVPSEICIFISILNIPVLILATLQYFKIWPDSNHISYISNILDFGIKNSFYRILILLGAFIPGLIAIIRYKFPILTAILYSSLFLILFDIFQNLRGLPVDKLNYLLTFCISSFIFLLSVIVDSKFIKDYSFWGYLISMVGIYFSMIIQPFYDSETYYLLVLLISIFFLLVSSVLKRKVILLFGFIGIAHYLVRISFKFFDESIFFPIWLIFLGVLLIMGGVLYNKKDKIIEQFLLDLLPKSLLNFLPKQHK